MFLGNLDSTHTAQLANALGKDQVHDQRRINECLIIAIASKWCKCYFPAFLHRCLMVWTRLRHPTSSEVSRLWSTFWIFVSVEEEQ